jgi:hypothetical protein
LGKEHNLPAIRLCSRRGGLAVDDEQNTCNQCRDSGNDIKDCPKAYAKQAQPGDYEEYSEQDPFQLIHVHFISPLNFMTGRTVP